MAIIPDVTVDFTLSPRVITIPASETSITVEDYQDTLLKIEESDEGMLWPHLRNTSGGEDLGGGTSVGWTMEMQNAVTAFAPRTTSISSGVITTGDTDGEILTDILATFQADGVLPGAHIVNFTDQSVSTVIKVNSEQQLICYPLGDGADNQWDVSDSYKIWNVEQCEITGGNNVAVDGAGSPISSTRPTWGTQILRTSSSSATTQELADIQYSSFQGKVWIDVSSSYSGTAFPVGTPRRPVNNIADAVSIANERGFFAFQIVGDITFGASDNLDRG